jgi:hypothetical protein
VRHDLKASLSHFSTAMSRIAPREDS